MSIRQPERGWWGFRNGACDFSANYGAGDVPRWICPVFFCFVFLFFCFLILIFGGFSYEKHEISSFVETCIAAHVLRTPVLIIHITLCDNIM